ncbi:glycosyl transferase [Frankia sp. CcI49]|uniref:glycosyltransferase family 2 protein n=1 Tax=unclassified Frankia TaxID=2632575 RepID=UPI0006C9ED2A|nr:MULTISPECIES: hypothetical protein [unclassified Frankia]KPM54913.1 glycosyl transferase [Frankia sp. R43]ONH61116.1 glycosyl transferase [Frankia sp. CcI49]
MKTVAVIVHRGPTEPTLDLATRLDVSTHLDQVTVIANDRAERPAGLPASVGWLIPPRDLGRGGAFRYAVETMPAAAAYLLVENNVRIDDPTIGACLELLAGANIGIVAPTLVDDATAPTTPARPTRFLVLPRILGNAPGDRPSEANWVTGAAMFVKAECHQRIPMDGRYFLGLEDVDFCHRVRDAGWSVVISPWLAWRRGAGPVPAAAYGYYEVRNRLWYTRIRRWHGRTAAALLWTVLATLPRATVLRPPGADGSHPGRLILHGLLDGLGPVPPSGDPRLDEPRVTRWTTWAPAPPHTADAPAARPSTSPARSRHEPPLGQSER